MIDPKRVLRALAEHWTLLEPLCERFDAGTLSLVELRNQLAAQLPEGTPTDVTALLDQWIRLDILVPVAKSPNRFELNAQIHDFLAYLRREHRLGLCLEIEAYLRHLERLAGYIKDAFEVRDAADLARQLRGELMELQRREQAEHGLRHFGVFAQVILDKLLAVTNSYRTEHVRLEGQQPLLDLMARGQGAVLVTAHMGCVELCQTLARQCPGLQLTILVHTRHAERFNRLLRRMAPDSGVQLLQVLDFNMATAMALADRVARGEFIAIAGDRVPVHESKTTQALFLGHEAAFPCGPYILSALLKCPLYFMGCVHEGRGYAVEFVPLAAQVELPRARRAQALAGYARLYARQLERLLCKAPYDWFNFFPFWDQATHDARNE